MLSLFLAEKALDEMALNRLYLVAAQKPRHPNCVGRGVYRLVLVRVHNYLCSRCPGYRQVSPSGCRFSDANFRSLVQHRSSVTWRYRCQCCAALPLPIAACPIDVSGHAASSLHVCNLFCIASSKSRIRTQKHICRRIAIGKHGPVMQRKRRLKEARKFPW